MPRPDDFGDREEMEEGQPISEQDEIDPEDFDAINQKDKLMARVKAVEFAYKTPEKYKRETTRISSYECGAFAAAETFDKIRGAIASGQDASQFSVLRAFMDSIYSLRRSVGGRHLEDLRKLAEASLLTEPTEEGNKSGWSSP